MADGSVKGAAELSAALAKGAAQVPRMMAVVVEKSAGDLVALTQINASHRPGPNAPTGDYRGSWRSEPVMGAADTVSWTAGTDRPQANRLEYGFGGTEAADTKGYGGGADEAVPGVDSLNRHYHQNPFPHHGPAVDVIEPQFYAAMEKALEKALPWEAR